MKSSSKKFSPLDIVLWMFSASIIVLSIWGAVTTLMDNPYDAATWVDFFVAGVTQGSMYALIAIGYTLVYGVLFMINFAHGEFFMSGIFTATVFIAVPLAESGYMDRHPVLALLAITIVSVLISIIVAVLTERIAYRPLRKAPRLVPLITAIGASFFWQNYFRALLGSETKGFPQMAVLDGKLDVFGIPVLKSRALVIVVTVIMLISLNYFIKKTKMGKAIRAVAENKDIAALMGIDVDRTITITFATGAAMAGVAGVLYALVFEQVQFSIGFIPGIKAFTAAVLGGIGSIPGAALGGLFIGIFEALGPPLLLEGIGIPATHQLKDVIAFTLLVLVLIYRPQGILGEKLAEEKA